MKTLALITLAALATGCASADKLATIANELKDNPAIISAKVNTLYGNATLIRVGNNTNSVTISPDGTVTINPAR